MRKNFRDNFRLRQNIDYKLYQTPEWKIPEKHKFNMLISDNFMKDSNASQNPTNNEIVKDYTAN